MLADVRCVGRSFGRVIIQLGGRVFLRFLAWVTQAEVNRAYGGSRCAKCVRTRIVRAFLIEDRLPAFACTAFVGD